MDTDVTNYLTRNSAMQVIFSYEFIFAHPVSLIIFSLSLQNTTNSKVLCRATFQVCILMQSFVSRIAFACLCLQSACAEN